MRLGVEGALVEVQLLSQCRKPPGASAIHPEALGAGEVAEAQRDCRYHWSAEERGSLWPTGCFSV